MHEIEAQGPEYGMSSTGRDDEDRWPEIQRKMIEAMLRLDRTFRSRIQALRV
jgi:hypothetical protein